MASLQRLLSHGYFPLEVPQPFTTSSYGKVVSAHRSLRSPRVAPTSKAGMSKTIGQLARHNLARAGQFARVLEIPNPALFYNLAAEIVSSSSEIVSTHFAGRPRLVNNSPPNEHRRSGNHHTVESKCLATTSCTLPVQAVDMC